MFDSKEFTKFLNCTERAVKKLDAADILLVLFKSEAKRS